VRISRAQIELSSRCNFKCVTCKHGYSEYGEDLSHAVCDMLIEDVLPGLDVLELQGTGESLLCTRTKDFIKTAAVNNTKVTLISNGSLLNDDIISELIAVGAQLVVSLDGSNETIYAMHRPVGDFNKIIENIKKINNIRQTNDDTGFSLVVNMVLTKLNHNSIPDMIELLSKLKADYLFVSEIRECMPEKDVWNKLNLLAESSTSGFTTTIVNCKSFAESKGIGFGFNPNIKPNGIKKKICESPWNHIFVSSNGNVLICCELPIIFGNLHKQNLTDILNSEKLQEFQNNMLNGNYDDHCLNCCLPWGLPY